MADPINEILQFAATGTPADGDVMTLEEYAASSGRLKGHQVGLANRALANTLARQTAHMAAGLAQCIAKHYEPGVVDDGDLAKVVTGLETVIAGIAASLTTAHASRTDNPHTVTAAQAAAVPLAGPASLTGGYSMAPLALGADSDGTVQITLGARNHQAVTVDHAAATFADPSDIATWGGGEVRLWLTMAAGAAFAGYGAHVHEQSGSFGEMAAGSVYLVHLLGQGDGELYVWIDEVV